MTGWAKGGTRGRLRGAVGVELNVLFGPGNASSISKKSAPAIIAEALF